MIQLTEKAKAQLDEYFATEVKTPIRIYLATGG